MANRSGDRAEELGPKAVGPEARVLSDLALVPALRAAFSPDAPHLETPPAGPERAARLLAFVIFVSHREVARWEGKGPSDVALPLHREELRSQTGLGRDRFAESLDILRRAGVLVDEEGGRVRLTAQVLRTEPLASGVEWPEVLGRIRGRGTDILLSWVLARHINPADTWREVATSDLARAGRFSYKTVARRLAKLVASGVVERHAPLGHAQQLRFADAVLVGREGRGGGAEEQGSQKPTAPAPTREASSAASSTRAVTPGGLEVELPPGAQLRIERGGDGTYRWRLFSAEGDDLGTFPVASP